ncbi:hypothetical protein [Agrobacterium fabrum]|uniref:hypothetical protein n=1 Tax=Agrobacterium fabrum TaxID=1176649 RepID=UPI000B85AB9F|nr:hypothetical protein [Agrobacterium fabrum]
MQSKGDVGYWLGWCLAFGMSGLFLIFLILQLDAGRGVFCTPDEQKCAREWLSALGGWAALIAAIPAAWFVFKQVELQRMLGKDTLWVSIKRDQVAAADLRGVASRLLADVRRYERKEGMRYSGPAELRQQLKLVRDVISGEDFAWLEKNIAHMWRVNAKAAVAAIDVFTDKFGPDIDSSTQNHVEALVYFAFNSSIATTRVYLEDCVEVLDKELGFYKTMLERYA